MVNRRDRIKPYLGTQVLLASYLLLVLVSLIAVSINLSAFYVISSVFFLWLNSRSLFLDFYKGFYKKIAFKYRCSFLVSMFFAAMMPISTTFMPVLPAITLFLALSFISARLVQIFHNEDGISVADFYPAKPLQYLPGSVQCYESIRDEIYIAEKLRVEK